MSTDRVKIWWIFRLRFGNASWTDTGAWLDGKEVSWFTKKDVTLLIKSFDIMHKSTSDINLSPFEYQRSCKCCRFPRHIIHHEVVSLHIAIIFFPLSLTPGAMILTRRHCHQLRYGRYFKSEPLRSPAITYRIFWFCSIHWSTIHDPLVLLEC